MNAISKLNLLAQKDGKDIPKYEFFGSGTEWTCKCTYQDTVSYSSVYTNKKDAKEDAAGYHLLDNPNSIENELTFDNMIILLDGDQRMDCWKWLATKRIDSSVIVCVFVSPTCPIIESSFNVIKSKTTNRDSSDAMLLVTLGRFLELDPNKTFLIISSDHILVQAAQDLNCLWASNLKQLQELNAYVY